MPPIANGSWYNIDPFSGVEYATILTGDGLEERFRHLASGFEARWNGEFETRTDANGNPWYAATGRIITMGTSGVPTKTTPTVDWEVDLMVPSPSYSKLGFMNNEGRLKPGVIDDWSHDDKKWTPGTGGAERMYTHPALGHIIYGTPENKALAWNAMVSWNREQLNRPRSMAPWKYYPPGQPSGPDPGDIWDPSGLSPNSKVDGNGGWNRGDVAHASRAQSYILAMFGAGTSNPTQINGNIALGIMNAWMEWRVYHQDTRNHSNLWQYVGDQERELGWLMMQAVRAHWLGFGAGHPDIMETFFTNGSGNIETPKQFAEALNTKILADWTDSWPWNPTDNSKTSDKILPQVTDSGSPNYWEVRGGYPWQFCFCMSTFAYALQSHVLSEASEASLTSHLSYIIADVNRSWYVGEGMPFAYGKHVWATQAEADAVALEAQEDHFAKYDEWVELRTNYREANPADSSDVAGWGISKRPKKRDYPHLGLWGIYYGGTSSHRMVVDSLNWYDPNSTDEKEYLNPLWRAMEKESL
jgi:hypothetical protein